MNILLSLEKYLPVKSQKKLIENIIYLFVLQGSNYIIPLITVPYLVKTLGPELYGLMAYSSANITFFLIFIDYGFNLTATKEISINRQNHAKIEEIFSAVIIIKLIILIACFLVLLFLVLFVNKYNTYWEVHFLTFCTVIGHTFSGNWFFQGVEKMFYITSFNIISKIFCTVFVFILIKNRSDYLIATALSSLSYLITGICSVLIIILKFKIRFKWQNLNIIIHYLRDGFCFLNASALWLK